MDPGSFIAKGPQTAVPFQTWISNQILQFWHCSRETTNQSIQQTNQLYLISLLKEVSFTLIGVTRGQRGFLTDGSLVQHLKWKLIAVDWRPLFTWFCILFLVYDKSLSFFNYSQLFPSLSCNFLFPTAFPHLEVTSGARESGGFPQPWNSFSWFTFGLLHCLFLCLGFMKVWQHIKVMFGNQILMIFSMS